MPSSTALSSIPHKNKNVFAVVVVSAVVVALGLVVPALADDRDAQRLEAVRQRIEHLTRELQSHISRRDALQAQLRQTDREIGELLFGLRKLDRTLKQEAGTLRRLETENSTRRKDLERNKAALAKTARATFLLGRQEYARLVLAQDDPARMGRMLTYYRYLNRARLQHMQQVRQDIEAVESLEQRTRAKLDHVRELRSEESRRKAALERARTERSLLLAKAQQTVRSQAQQIAHLRQDEQELLRLLNGLNQALQEAPTNLTGRFSDYRGKLPMPVMAKLAASFGSPQKAGNLKWKGVLLAAPPGRDVRAVFGGRVAFADWLPGYGLLLIVEHGEGYMTLYGHNQSLYKRTGEPVEAGEVIAATGDTGRFSTPGLYFEIRHNGEPHDPLRWCRR